MNATDKNRKAAKVKAVMLRLEQIDDADRDLLLEMLDETKLDLMILALGIGSVRLSSDEE